MAKQIILKVAKQPKNLDIQLFAHQLSNIWNMEQMEKNKYTILPDGNILEGSIGVLGDPPGTGKTLTVIGLICRDKMKWDDQTINFKSQLGSNNNGSIRIIKEIPLVCIRTTLIVTPLSIFHQWEDEIKHTNLSYKMIDKRSDCYNIEKYEIVVCTVNMYNDIVLKYQNVCFKRFIYDEMDSSYIKKMAHINAGFSWFVSATFSQLLSQFRQARKDHYMKKLFLNIFSDIYSANSLLESITIRSTEKLRSLRPIPFEYKSMYYEVCRAPIVRELKDHMNQDLMQMIDSGNIKDAIRYLGGTENDSNIAELIRRNAYEKVQEAKVKVSKYEGQQLEKWIQRLSEAERTLASIEDRIKNIEMENCTLCREEMKNPTLLGCCQNIACVRCLVMWMKNRISCPYCRNENPALIHLSSYSHKDQDEEKIPINTVPGDKFGFLEKIAASSKKLLIFATHDNQFREIATCLKRKNISFSLLSGSVNRRQSMLNEYITGNTRVLILNSRMNGAGLNLQITTDIIMWHLMPLHLTKQIIGRALRYGINHTLVVHKFFHQEEENEYNADN